jgi:CheY-like chemotaxis protein
MFRNVLIVDDNQDSADTMAMVLRCLGHAVRVVYSGRDAIAECLDRPPELVFIDLQMPRISGFDLLRELRDLPGMAQTKLVCLTGFGDGNHRSKAEACGCDAYLIKPAELADVNAILSEKPTSAIGCK